MDVVYVTRSSTSAMNLDFVKDVILLNALNGPAEIIHWITFVNPTFGSVHITV